MIHIRKEGEAVRQGFNVYPLSDEGSFGLQMLFWKLRIELRWSKRAKRIAFRVWLKKPVKNTEEEFIYIPGYTEELKKLYEKQNAYWGKKYEDWAPDDA